MSAHGSLVAAVISYINARGGYAFKVQSGVLPLEGRFIHTGKAGVPDVIGVLPYDGRMIAVEIKTGTGRLTAVQKRVHADLAKRGALVIVARDIRELEKALA